MRRGTAGRDPVRDGFGALVCSTARAQRAAVQVSARDCERMLRGQLRDKSGHRGAVEAAFRVVGNLLDSLHFD